MVIKLERKRREREKERERESEKERDRERERERERERKRERERVYVRVCVIVRVIVCERLCATLPRMNKAFVTVGRQRARESASGRKSYFVFRPTHYFPPSIPSAARSRGIARSNPSLALFNKASSKSDGALTKSYHGLIEFYLKLISEIRVNGYITEQMLKS